jgi:exonuclease SbcC
MQPRSLRIKNIGPYKDVSIDLAAVPGALVAITGLNGQGKTMLMESIFAGCFREFPTRPDGIYKFCTDRNAAIELEFEMGGKIYRSFLNIDSKTRKMEAVLSLDKQPINDGKTSTFDEVISGILGSSDQILASSYGAQDKKGNFTELAKSQRKDLFIKMIGLSKLQRISEVSKTHGQMIEPEKTNLEGQLLILRETSSRTIPDVAALKNSLLFTESELTLAQEKFEELAKKIALEGVQYEKLPEITHEWSAGVAKWSDLRKSLESALESHIVAQSIVDKGPALKIELASNVSSLIAFRERLTILREKYSRITELKTREVLLKNKYEARADDCHKTILQIGEQSALAQSISSLREKAESLAKARKERDESESTLRQVNSERIRSLKEDSEKSKVVFELASKINKLAETELQANKSLALARTASKSLKEVPCQGVGEYSECPLIKSAVESNNKIDEYVALADNCKIALLAARQEFDALPKPDEAGQKLMEKKIKDLTQAIAAASSLISALELAVAKLPASEAAASKVILLQESLKTQEQARDLASVDHEEVELAIQEISGYQTEANKLAGEIPSVEAKVSELESEINKSEMSRSILVPLAAEIQRLQEEIVFLEKKNSELRSEMKKLEEIIKSVDENIVTSMAIKDETIPALKKVVSSLQADIAKAENDSLLIREAQSKLTEAQSQLDAVVYRMACYERVSKSFGPMEIQSFEIDSAGPEVSRLANELLFNCFGPRFSIRFVTQELKADGKGYKDEFDVSVDDQKTGKTVSISDLSGGEKTIVSEALSLAITLYNKEKNGVAWDTLFRDEVSGSLDDIYDAQYIKMLRAAREMGHFKRVYFICHQPKLKSMADSRIIVDNGTLTVEA